MIGTIPKAGPWNSYYEDSRYVCDYLTPDSCVLDLGAYKGEFAFKIQEKYNCNVYAYEPIEEFCDAIDSVNNSKINVNRFALGENDGTETIVIGGEGTTLEKYDRANNPSHKGEPNKDLQKAHTTKIKVVNIIDEMQKYDSVDLMKINTEGSEYEILSSLVQSGDIKRIKYLQVQFHSFVSDAYTKYEEIKEQVNKTHNISLDSLWKWTFWQRKNEEC